MKLLIAVMLFIVLVFNIEAKAEYDKDYLEYDEYGLKEVRCMKCDEPIKKRTIKLHKLEDGRAINVYTVKTLSSFSPIPYELSDGSFTNILMCKDCARDHVDTLEERQGMAKQLKSGWILEAEGTNRSQKEIDAIEKRTKWLTVTKRHKFKGGRR